MNKSCIVAIALALASCGGKNTQVVVQVPSASWPGVYYEVFDRVTDAADLEPLRRRGPRAYREARIWIGGGLAYPQEMWRLVESEEGWEGELILYWEMFPELRGPDGREWRRMIPQDAKRWCDRLRRGQSIRVCRGDLAPDIDWSMIASELHATGLWDLPDPSDLPYPERFIADGWSLQVELRSGDRYRSYGYSNPDTAEWPEFAQATEIARILSQAGPIERYEVDSEGRPLDAAAVE